MAGTGTEGLQQLLAAFNAHDLDRIMGFFTDDCVLETPRGDQAWGTRFEGTTTDGVPVRVRGCDLFDLDADGRIRRKDSYWKIVQP